MSRLCWLLTLVVLLLAGCAAVGTTPQTSTSAAAGQNYAALSAPSSAGYRTTPLPSPLSLQHSAPADDLAVEADLGEAGDELAAAVDEEEALDPETIEDNAVLQDANLAAPEEEGETVFLDENDFDFPVVDNEKVRYFVDYFSGPIRKNVRNWLERSTRYLPMMQEIFVEQGLPRDLVYLAMIESGFNNKAFSRARASGPWQFIESTGRAYGLSNDGWRDERRDPEKATRAAARHLADLYRMFDGDWYLALAAYNAGAGKIGKAIERYGTRDFWQLTHGSYLKEETKHYVPKMLAALLIAKHPERYGFTDLNYQEPLAYELAEIPSATDIEVIARLAGTDIETIKKLNPELKRWSTPLGVGSYEIRLPVGTGAAFAERYAQLPENERVNFVQHTVRKGDTPGAIARRYGVGTDELLRFNKVRNVRSLRIGQSLLIPLNPQAGGMSLAELRESLRDDSPVKSTKTSTTRGKTSGGKTYTVRSGDNLWKIARNFKVTEQQLRSWNGLGGKSALKPGQKLVIAADAGQAQVAGVTGKKPAASATGNALQKVVYQVRAGDTLWGIGRQFDVEADQIRDWNKLPRNPVLRPGQRLTLLVRNNSRG